MQGAPDHPKACALRPAWSFQKVSNCLHHKGRWASDPSMTGFVKNQEPGEQQKTEKRERKKRVRNR